MSSTSTVVPLRQPDTVDDPLTAVLRDGARRLLAQRWSPFFGQAVKLGSPDEKDGPDDGQAEAVWS